MTVRSLIAAGFAIGLLAAASTASAQPKFEYGKQEEVKGVEWKASAQLNFILSTGNAQVTTLGASGNVSRKEGNNKVLLEANGAYARSRIRTATDLNASGNIDSNAELGGTTQTSPKLVLA